MAPTQPKPCVCKAKTQPTSSDVICCEKCQAWMHDVCIGIPAAEFSRIDKYYCLLCISKTPTLRITYSRPSIPPKSSTDVLLEKLIEKLDALCDGLTKVISRVDALEQKVADSPPDRYGQPPADMQQPFDIAAVASQVIADQQVAERKKLRAVLEGIDEQSPEEDVALIRDIAEKCGVAAELDAEHIHRHGRGQQDRGRIIKVPFSSFDARNKFLRSFASAKKSLDLRSTFPKVSARRDLTPLELKTHYALKKRAYLLNRECMLYKYHYVDLKIVTLPNPKPLRQANVESRALDESLANGEQH
ncbi:zinc finger protein [Aphelenchoides avenae]|nr:zinc finger protein [Aphelenchus avenae]